MNTCYKRGIATNKIFSSVEASSAPPTNHVPSIMDVIQMVKDCGVLVVTTGVEWWV
jgi:hypothetical protein